MPLYSYKAQDSRGKIIEGTIQGSKDEEVSAVLKSEGSKLLTLKKIDTRGDIFGYSISTQDKAEFCRLMSTMLRSGLSVPDSVEIISQDTKNKKMQKVLADISSETSKGKSISSVLLTYEKDFGSVFLTMVRAGEESGTLDQSFEYLSKQLAASYDLSQKIKGALMYPAVIIMAMIAEGILMFVFVLPKISEVFLKMDIDLPTYTKVIFSIGAFTDKYTAFVIGSIIISMVAAFLFVLLKPTRNILMRLLSKVPVIKKILDQIDIARFARTLSTLLKSGVSIIESLDVAVGSMGQQRMKRAGKKFSEGVGRGESLSDILLDSQGTFPAVVVQTIRAGEKTGNLEDVLIEMAEFYEKEVDHSLKRLTSLLEPVLMLAIGIAVGAMVIVMMAPIYSIMGNLQEAAQ